MGQVISAPNSIELKSVIIWWGKINQNRGSLKLFPHPQ
jgi:hypothetical protein